MFHVMIHWVINSAYFCGMLSADEVEPPTGFFQPVIWWGVTSIISYCMRNKFRLILILASMKYNWGIRFAISFKTMHSVYWQTFIEHLLLSKYQSWCQNCVGRDVFFVGQNRPLCPHGASSSKSNVKGKGTKSLHPFSEARVYSP